MHHQSYLDKLAFSAGRGTKEEQYWLNQLSGNLEKTSFPYDNKKNKASSAAEPLKFEFTGKLFEKLMKLSSDSYPRLHMILTAGLVALLNKYTGINDIIIGTSIYKQDIQARFVNSVLALRNPLTPHMTFKELLLQVRTTIIAADENQNYPIELILQKLKIPYGINDDFPLFDAAILLENIQDKSYLQHIKTNMIFCFLKEGEHIKGVVEYNCLLYKKSTIKRIVTHFRHLLQRVLFNVDIPLAGISILTQEEKKHLLFAVNNTNVQYPEDKTLYELFWRQQEKEPDRIAIVHKDQHLTYYGLNEKAGQWAHLLRAKGIKPDHIIGIMIEPSIEMIAAILGILKAGAAFLPIDPNYPEERITYMLKDSNAQVLLTDNPLRHFNCQLLMVNEKSPISRRLNIPPKEANSINNYQLIINNLQLKRYNLAYILYTSGTTGKPKGVMINHQSIVNYIWWAAKTYTKYQKSAFPLFTSICFDLTMTSLFTPLLTGSTIVIYEQDENTLPMQQIINEDKVGSVKLTPSHLKLINQEEGNIPAPNIKCLIVGGEELRRDLALDIYKKFNENIEIYNEYGPTEAAVGCMIYRFDPKEDYRKSVPIGKPIDNTQVYIMTAHFNLVPIGVAGELYIGGVGVARGYLNQPELTAQKFCLRRPGGALFEKTAPPGPPRKNFLLKGAYKSGYHRSYRSYKSYVLYRTGDLARWLEEGNIEFLGRIDQQVKIRGFRIEPGEIESLLQRHKNIKETVVAVRIETDEKYLCAYIVSDHDLQVSQLREYLLKDLPGYMIPSYFVFLEKIPLTPNGKVDWNALPEPQTPLNKSCTPPRNPLEEKLMQIWQEVLAIKKDNIGIENNFFEMGGHSLKATILLIKIHKELHLEIPLQEFFKRPSIKGLSEFIHQSMLKEVRFLSIEPAEKKDYYPLSPAQKRLYILQQMALESTNYNLTQCVCLEGQMDAANWEKAFLKLIRRHEILQTSFDILDDKPIQRINEDVDFEIKHVDCKRARVEVKVDDTEGTRGLAPLPLEPATRNSQLATALISSFIRPFDLTQAPLLRVGLLKLEEQKHLLIVDTHHIISDGVSLFILTGEFMALLDGQPLTGLRIQYKDYSQWQNRGQQQKSFKNQGDYWLKEFSAELPLLHLPIDYPRPTIKKTTGDVLKSYIGKNRKQQLEKLALEKEATLYMACLAIFFVFLYKLTGQEDLIVGTDTAGRRHADLQKVIGMFVNTLALRSFPKGEKTFEYFLEKTKQRTMKALENQDYPFEELVEQVAVTRDPGRNPLFDVAFYFSGSQDINTNAMDIPEVSIPGLILKPYESNSKTAKFDLMLFISESGDQLVCAFEYCTSLFRREKIQAFAILFEEILSAVLENPQIKLDSINVSLHLLAAKPKEVKLDDLDF
jgi:tyrocidine synthetase-3